MEGGFRGSGGGGGAALRESVPELGTYDWPGLAVVARVASTEAHISSNGVWGRGGLSRRNIIGSDHTCHYRVTCKEAAYGQAGAPKYQLAS